MSSTVEQNTRIQGVFVIVVVPLGLSDLAELVLVPALAPGRTPP